MQEHDLGSAGQHTRLYPHQTEGVAFLMRQHRAILGDDRGLGKTCQAILAMGQSQPAGTILVVCPNGLQLHWHREILLANPAARVEVIGTRITVRDGRPSWVVVHYGLLPEYAERLRVIPWDGIILDDVPIIGGGCTGAGHVMRLLDVADDDQEPVPRPLRVYLLTSAPIPVRPCYAYNLLRCIGHPAVRSLQDLAKPCDEPDHSGQSAITDALDLVWREVMLRRTREELPDLPSRIRTWVPVEVDAPGVVRAQQRFLGWLQDTAAASPNDKALLGEWQRVRLALHKAKHQALATRIRDLLERGEKLLVFTTFAAGAKRHAAGIGAAGVIIDGEASVAARLRAMHIFQTDASVRIGFCTPVNAGPRIPLTAATHMIFQDLDWNLANLARAEDLVHRPGQVRPVTVEYLFGAGTLDQHMAELLATRLALIQPSETPVLRALAAQLRPLAATLLAEPPIAVAADSPARRIAAVGAAISVSGTAGAELYTFIPMPRANKPRRRGRAGDGRLLCICPTFGWRGDCDHLPVTQQQAVG